MIFFISLIEFSIIKFLFISIFHWWSIYIYILFLLIYFFNFSKIRFDEKIDKFYFLTFTIIAIVIILTPLTSEDLLYYYIPIAKYLNLYLDFPHNILPSHSEAPFAYPPIEYFLLSILFDFTKDEIFIKFLLILKVYIFLILFKKIIKLYNADEKILLAFFFVPFFISNSIFGYYQDINLLLAILSYLILKKEKDFLYIFIIFCIYATLSKYTNIVFYTIFTIYVSIFDRNNFKYILIPYIFLIPFLIKNYLYYKNPLFPIMAKIFNSLDWIQSNFLHMLTARKIDINLFLYLISSYILYFLYKFLKAKEFIFLFASIVIWIFFMNTQWSGATIRFLFPIIFLGFLFLQEKDIKYIILMGIASVGLELAFKNYVLLFFSLVSLFYFSFVLKIKSYKKLFIIVLITLSFLRIYQKGICFKNSYECFPGNDKHIDFLSKQANIITDLWVLPFELRYNNNILPHDSYMFYHKYQKNKIREFTLYVNENFFKIYKDIKCNYKIRLNTKFVYKECLRDKNATK